MGAVNLTLQSTMQTRFCGVELSDTDKETPQKKKELVKELFSASLQHSQWPLRGEQDPPLPNPVNCLDTTDIDRDTQT